MYSFDISFTIVFYYDFPWSDPPKGGLCSISYLQCFSIISSDKISRLTDFDVQGFIAYVNIFDPVTILARSLCQLLLDTWLDK